MIGVQCLLEGSIYTKVHLKEFVSGSAMIAVNLLSPFFELKLDDDAAFIGGWCLFKGGI